MTKTMKLVAGSVLGLALVAGTGAAVFAAREQGPQGPGMMGPGGRGMRGPGGPGDPGGPGGPLMALRGLDLTDTQREQVKATMDGHKSEFEGVGSRMQAARQALDTAITAETFDEGAVRQKAADVALVEADGAVLRAKVHSEVWALLTPEQQAKAKTLKTEMASRRGQVRERIKQRRNDRQERRRQAL